MDTGNGLGSTAIVVVRHPENGTLENGRGICDEVRRLLGDHAGPVCFFHDASEMSNANLDYAAEFKTLDGELSGRNVTTVCAIPGLVPRIMALTVSKVSSRNWEIFKSREEAVDYLCSLGADKSQLAPPVGNVGIRLNLRNVAA